MRTLSRKEIDAVTGAALFGYTFATISIIGGGVFSYLTIMQFSAATSSTANIASTGLAAAAIPISIAGAVSFGLIGLTVGSILKNF